MTAPYQLVDAFLQMPQISRRAVRAEDGSQHRQVVQTRRCGEARLHHRRPDARMDAAEVEKGCMTAAALKLTSSPYNVGTKHSR